MKYSYKYSPEAEKDLENFNRHQTEQITKALDKVVKNPLPQNEGGLGKPIIYAIVLETMHVPR